MINGIIYRRFLVFGNKKGTMKNFEKKREAAKEITKAVMEKMYEAGLPPEDTLDVLGLAMAAICAGVPDFTTPKEAIGTFLSVFASSLQALNEKEGEK